MKFIVKGKVQSKKTNELNTFPYNIVLDTETFIKFELILVKPDFDQVQEGQYYEFYIETIGDKMFGFLSEKTREEFTSTLASNPSTPISTVYKKLCMGVVNNVINKLMQETNERDVIQALLKLGYSREVVDSVVKEFKERYGQYPDVSLTTTEFGILLKKHIEMIGTSK